MAQKGADWPAS